MPTFEVIFPDHSAEDIEADTMSPGATIAVFHVKGAIVASVVNAPGIIIRKTKD